MANDEFPTFKRGCNHEEEKESNCRVSHNKKEWEKEIKSKIRFSEKYAFHFHLTIVCPDDLDRDAKKCVGKFQDDFEESADGDGKSSGDEDYSDDGDEGTEGYKLGGYHPVSIGEKFNTKYIILEKLGWGHFSTVWMAYDRKAAAEGGQEFIALKIQKSASHYREAAMDEIELLNCVMSMAKSEAVRNEHGTDYKPCIVMLLDYFDHSGPHGKHVCMCFEILGENLLKVIKKYDYRGIPISVVKNFIRQICAGLDFLHRHCSIIHTDLKPENILVATAPPIPNMEYVKILTAGGKGKEKMHHIQQGGKCSDEGDFVPEGLSAEDRKKLKKKLKKKRQQVRKSDAKKRVNRRKPCKGMSAEKVMKEMFLMELDSYPRNTETGHPNRGEILDVSFSSLEHEDLNRKEFCQFETAKNEVLDPQVLSGYITSQSSNNLLVTEGDTVMPTWMRPSLFSFINLLSHENEIGVHRRLLDTAHRETEILFDQSIQIVPDQWIPPPAELCARISMVMN